MVNWRNTRLPKLEGENEITSVFEMVINKTYELGFQYCSFKMSSQRPHNHTKSIDMSNYPKEWSSVYNQAHFFEIDPVVKHCKNSVLPIVWEENTFKDAPSLWSLANTLGVNVGWTQAVHDFQGVFSMLTLARSKDQVSPEELYEKAGQVLWLCHAMHAVVVQKYAETFEACPASKLTPREKEILMWSGMGKTAADIARILCLSERTVGFHICSCFKKLGVNNKIAAVLSAARRGII